MTITPVIYDWRLGVVPRAQLVLTPGMAADGGLTVGGAAVRYPVPGGRVTLFMTFGTLRPELNVDASWLYSRVSAYAVMRIPIRVTDQLVPASDLGGAALADGQTWANGQPWANGENWAWAPFAPVAAAALRGAETFTVNMGDAGQVLRIGHLIGFTSGVLSTTHKVMDISYDADDVATVRVSPTLRRDLEAGDHMLFRPSIIATCANPASFAAQFDFGRFTSPGSVEFREFLL